MPSDRLMGALGLVGSAAGALAGISWWLVGPLAAISLALAFQWPIRLLTVLILAPTESAFTWGERLHWVAWGRWPDHIERKLGRDTGEAAIVEE